MFFCDSPARSRLPLNSALLLLIETSKELTGASKVVTFKHIVSMIAGTDGTVLHLAPLVHDLVVDVDVASLPDTNAATKRVLMNDASLDSGCRAVDYDRRLGDNLLACILVGPLLYIGISELGGFKRLKERIAPGAIGAKIDTTFSGIQTANEPGHNSSRQTRQKKQVAIAHKLTTQDKTNDRQNRYPLLSTLLLLFLHLNSVLIMDS